MKNVRVDRPTNYYAEMFKTDEHMEKIRDNLVKSQERIGNYEEKLLRKQTSKMHKKIKHMKNLEKSKEKRTNLQAIENWKSEIKNKGDKAKDLNDFVRKEKNQDFSKKKDFKKKTDYKSPKKNNNFMNMKSKKIKKKKRLGKVARNNLKSKHGIKKKK